MYLSKLPDIVHREQLDGKCSMEPIKLFYFISFYSILSCFILFCLILFRGVKKKTHSRISSQHSIRTVCCFIVSTSTADRLRRAARRPPGALQSRRALLQRTRGREGDNTADKTDKAKEYCVRSR